MNSWFVVAFVGVVAVVIGVIIVVIIGYCIGLSASIGPVLLTSLPCFWASLVCPWHDSGIAQLSHMSFFRHSLSLSLSPSITYSFCLLLSVSPWPWAKKAPQFCQFITRFATNDWMNEMNESAPQWNVSNNNKNNSSTSNSYNSNCNTTATTRTRTITITTKTMRDHKKCINLMESFPLLCTLYGYDFCRVLFCCCCFSSCCNRSLTLAVLYYMWNTL